VNQPDFLGGEHFTGDNEITYDTNLLAAELGLMPWEPFFRMR